MDVRSQFTSKNYCMLKIGLRGVVLEFAAVLALCSRTLSRDSFRSVDHVLGRTAGAITFLIGQYHAHTRHKDCVIRAFVRLQCCSHTSQVLQ